MKNYKAILFEDKETGVYWYKSEHPFFDDCMDESFRRNQRLDGYVSYHLYIIDDERINLESKFIGKRYFESIICFGDDEFYYREDENSCLVRKIVATSDTTTKLPYIEDSDYIDYVVGNYKPDVEYDVIVDAWEEENLYKEEYRSDGKVYICKCCGREKYMNIVPSYSCGAKIFRTIKVHPPKTTWKYDEVEKLCRDAYYSGFYDGIDCCEQVDFHQCYNEDEWIKNNLKK